MQVRRPEPGERLLDHDVFGVGEEVTGLDDRLLVPGDQPDRRLAGQRD
jgi:hypothetical protein